MDIKNLVSHRRARKTRKGETARLAAQLAPLEEQDKKAAVNQLVTKDPESAPAQAASDFGGMIVDNTDLHVPNDILEGGGQKTYLGMEPVVFVILGLMLAFIAFVAWQISLMPAK